MQQTKDNIKDRIAHCYSEWLIHLPLIMTANIPLSTEEFFKLFEQWLDPWLEDAEESDNKG